MCAMGATPGELKTDTGHGVLFGGAPLMNANDHMVDVNISSFGICTIKTTLANGVPQQCKPMTILPWLMVNNKFLVDGAPALTTNSKLPCMCGGVISIIPDPPPAPSAPAPSKAETSADEKEKMQTEKETVTVKNEVFTTGGGSSDKVYENNELITGGAITGAGATKIAGAFKVAKEGMDLAEEFNNKDINYDYTNITKLIKEYETFSATMYDATPNAEKRDYTIGWGHSVRGSEIEKYRNVTLT